MFSFVLGKYLEVGLLGKCVYLKTKWHFKSMPNTHSSLVTILQWLFIAIIRKSYHSKRSGMSGFYLPPSSTSCNPSSHVFYTIPSVILSHSSVFLEQVQYALNLPTLLLLAQWRTVFFQPVSRLTHSSSVSLNVASSETVKVFRG